MKIVSAKQVKAWLSEKSELAFLDVREFGRYTAGHPFFSVSLPYSIFESRLMDLVPNLKAPVVVFDDNDGVAELSATRAELLGFDSIMVLDGGVQAWVDAGYNLFEGVNLPSKTFGEFLEHACDTPRISAQQLYQYQQENKNLKVLDGRPFTEFRKMSIPGATSCPNGELALRYKDLVPDPTTTIVINCAGRTRSILGAQTLINLDVPNPVLALENGTQGWFLAGLQLDHGKTACYSSELISEPGLNLQQVSKTRAQNGGVSFIDAPGLKALLTCSDQTTYLLDVRTAEEFVRESVGGFLHAPGGQLVQSTDSWVAVRGANLVLIDDEQIRAPVTATWLAQMGHKVFVVTDGVSGLRTSGFSVERLAPPALVLPEKITSKELASQGDCQILDFRAGMDYRDAHLEKAQWLTRQGLVKLQVPDGQTLVLISQDAVRISMANKDILINHPEQKIYWLAEDESNWREAGLNVIATPNDPPDHQCIDFNFHTHDRHQGNAQAARDYLAWEIGLVDQVDEQERAFFRIM